MCDFQIPNLLYYAYLPALFLSLIFAFFILFADRKSQINRNLFIFVIIFSGWILNDLIAWLVQLQSVNLFIERISLLEVFSVLFFLYFAHAFTGKLIAVSKKILFALPFVPIVALLFTDYNVYVIDAATCQNQNGLLYLYVYFLVIFYIAWSIRILFSAYMVNNEEQEKRQIRIIIFAIAFFATWFLMLVGGWYLLTINKIESGDSIYLLLPLGMVIFIGMLSTAIVKYKLFNIKLVAAQVLTYAIWILVASQLLFVENVVNVILISTTLLFSVIFGIVLIRSVRAEIERKEELQFMADRLAVANDKLRELDNAKTEFVSIASHQLRTPLTAIKGFVSLLIEGSYGEMNPEAQNAINKVHISTERLIRLVEELLNVSRIESGRMEYKFENQDICALLADMTDSFAMIAKEKDLSFEMKLPEGGLPHVSLDPAKMREVISNLIDNAIKYTERGGVTVKAEFDSESRYKSTLSNDDNDSKFKQKNLREMASANGYVRITVSDTGIGIPASEIPYLFAKFSRGKDTQRLHVGGTGLGLYVGKGIVEAHKGAIWIESGGDGRGSRFIIELPVV